MKTPAHTPTPWEASGDMIFAATRTILVADCKALLHPNFKAKDPKTNAAFIVRAVNSHQALVEALEAIEIALRADSREKTILPDTVEYHLDGQMMYQAINKARAALTLAKGA